MSNKAKLNALKNVIKRKDNTMYWILGGAVVIVGGIYLMSNSNKPCKRKIDENVERVYKPLLTQSELDEYNSLRKKADLSVRERERLNYLIDRVQGNL